MDVLIDLDENELNSGFWQEIIGNILTHQHDYDTGDYKCNIFLYPNVIRIQLVND